MIGGCVCVFWEGVYNLKYSGQEGPHRELTLTFKEVKETSQGEVLIWECDSARVWSGQSKGGGTWKEVRLGRTGWGQIMKCNGLALKEWAKSSGRFERGVTLFRSCVVMAFLAVVLRTDCRGEGRSWEINEEAIVITQGRGGTSVYYISSLRLERPWKANTTKLFVYWCSSPLCLVMVGTEDIFLDF